MATVILDILASLRFQLLKKGLQEHMGNTMFLLIR